MQNSYVTYVHGVYVNILKDVLTYFSTDHADVERDLARLTSAIKHRGLKFYTLDLPAIGKQFDHCLSTGRLDLSRFPHSRRFARGTAIPRLFKGLLLRVFDKSGLLKTNPDIDAIFLLRQLYYAAKKLEIPCDESLTYDSVRDFVQIDANLLLPTADWQDEVLDIKDVSLLDGLDSFSEKRMLAPTIDLTLLATVQKVADVVSSSIGHFDPSWWNPRHGPGAVADQKRGMDKYLFPTWSSKLNNVFPLDTFAFANLSLWADAVGDNGDLTNLVDCEVPSRLICVPKTQKGPRLIASESVSQQWCQQIIRDFLVTRLACTPISDSIHFDDQSQNQEAARLASLSDDAWTIDLSSASDRLSCWTVERIFRKNHSLLHALHSSRTRFCENKIDKKSPRFISLRKFSCMGSACTFPVQTYVFAICAIGSLLHSRGVTKITNRTIRNASAEVQVFGDDIIIPSDGGNNMLDVLQHLQLKVNTDKTYTKGNFRESCGFDAFMGHFVSPISIKRVPHATIPESVVSCVDSSNRFYERGLQHTSSYIKLTVSQMIRLRIPEIMPGSGSFGWYNWLGFSPGSLKKRFDRDLQQLMIFTTLPFSKVRISPTEGNSALLQYFTEDPSPDVFWKSGTKRVPKLYLKSGWKPLTDFL